MKATVRIIEVVVGSYGMHGGDFWSYDDLPSWRLSREWQVRVELTGPLNWGPCKHRENAKKEHSGTTRVQIRHGNRWTSRSYHQAEEGALKIGCDFEEIGFDVDIIKLERPPHIKPMAVDTEMQPFFENTIEFLEDPPPWWLQSRARKIINSVWQQCATVWDALNGL